MTPSSTATSAKVIVISYYSLLTPCKGRNSVVVSHHSLTHREPVPALFSEVFRRGWRIRFGHRTFPWQSEAARAAAVHCVIVGFDKDAAKDAEVFEYDSRGVLTHKSKVPFLNAYLSNDQNLWMAFGGVA